MIENDSDKHLCGYPRMKWVLLYAGMLLLTVVTLGGVARGGEGPSDLLADAVLSVSHREAERATGWRKDVTFEGAGVFPVSVRAIFQVTDTGSGAWLLLQKPDHVEKLTLNGMAIQKPMEGMRHKLIPGIPASLLKTGTNVLQGEWSQRVRIKKAKATGEETVVPEGMAATDLTFKLFALSAAELAFQSGPILGYAGEDFFTVSCRVNMPAEVVLEVNGQQYTSKPGLLHTFKAEGLTAGTQYQYTVKARSASDDDFSASTGPHSVRTLPANDPFTFTILGDSRSFPRVWGEVSRAVFKAQPIFTVFVGDMVTSGRRDYQWDEEFFGPARDFLAGIPFYGIIGNHEQNCPLFLRMFATPGGKNWSQAIGSVLIIGIDGAMDWTRGGELAKWLEGVLSESDASFIFLASHYPAWSSGPHGGLNADGRPREVPVRRAQDVLMPLSKRYGITAMFAGHDHFYERSEPEEGVTVIMAGGAGAPLYGKVADAEVQNPHSEVFAIKHHFCLLTVDGKRCTMQVLGLDGALIDTRTWQSRDALQYK